MKTSIIIILIGALPVSYSFGHRYGYEAASQAALVSIQRVSDSCKTNMQALEVQALANMGALGKTCSQLIDEVSK